MMETVMKFTIRILRLPHAFVNSARGSLSRSSRQPIGLHRLQRLRSATCSAMLCLFPFLANRGCDCRTGVGCDFCSAAPARERTGIPENKVRFLRRNRPWSPHSAKWRFGRYFRRFTENIAARNMVVNVQRWIPVREAGEPRSAAPRPTGWIRIV